MYCGVKYSVLLREVNAACLHTLRKCATVYTFHCNKECFIRYAAFVVAVRVSHRMPVFSHHKRVHRIYVNVVHWLLYESLRETLHTTTKEIPVSNVSVFIPR